MRARTDVQFFRRTYLHDSRRVASSSILHDDLEGVWGRICDPKRLADLEAAIRSGSDDRPDAIREVRAAPRGHAKSSIFTQDMVIHAALYGYKRYVIILKDDQLSARKEMAGILNTLRTNEAVLRDFGTLVNDRRASQDRAVLKNGVRIEIVGMRQGTRGFRSEDGVRPDLFIIDDPEDDLMVYSESTRRKTRSDFFNNLTHAGDPRTDYAFIGTCLHPDALIVNVLKNPKWRAKGTSTMGVDGPPIYQAVLSYADRQDLWEQWRAIFSEVRNPNRADDARMFFLERREEMLEGAEVLWPEFRPYYELMCSLAGDGSASFSSELMNIPRAEGEQIFDSARMTFLYPAEFNVEAYDRIVGYWDPSVGVDDAAAQHRGARDWAAFVVLGIHQDGFYDVLDVQLTKGEVEDQIKLWWAMDENWRCDNWGVESVGFQRVCLTVHKYLLGEHNLKRKSAGEPAWKGPNWVLRGQWRNKVARITRLQAPLHNGLIRIFRNSGAAVGAFVRQLDIFPAPHEMDGPDALEGAYRMVQPRRRAFEGFLRQGESDV